jgi:hypothetical protein
MEEQLFLFQESKEERLEREVKRLIEQSEKVRKSLYSRLCAQNKLLTELKNDLDILTANICKKKEPNLFNYSS